MGWMREFFCDELCLTDMGHELHMVATCFRTVAPPCWMGEREGKRARSTSLIVICVRFRPHFVRPCLRPSVRQAVGAEEAASRTDGRRGGRGRSGRRCAGKFSHHADNAAQMRSQSRSGCWLSLSHSLSLSLPLSFLSFPLHLPLRMRSRFHSRSWPSVASPRGRKRRGRTYIYYHSTPLS